MHAGEILLVIGLNCIILAGFLYLQGRVVERRLRNLKNEILELEDLVAAILEEFEEVAASLETQPPNSPERVQTPHLAAEPPPDPLTAPEMRDSLETPPAESPLFSEPEFEQKAIHHPNCFQAADSRHVQILELWKNGIPIEEIARQLGTGKGEVRLVLGIYHKL